MSNSFQEQIEEMEPRRYARAAKRAATLAKKLAERGDIEVSAAIRHLADTSEEKIAAERTQQLLAGTKSAQSTRRSGSGDFDVEVGSDIRVGDLTYRIVGGSQQLAVGGRGAGAGGGGGGTGPIPETPLEDLSPQISKLSKRQLPTVILGVDHTTGLTDVSRGVEPTVLVFGPGLEPKKVGHFDFDFGWKLETLSPGGGFRKHLQGDRPQKPPLHQLGNLLKHKAVSDRDWRELWEAVFANAPLEEGRHVDSENGQWTVGRRVDGDVYVSPRGRAPVSMPLQDDDVVRVDTSRGLLVIQTRPSHRWFGGTGHAHETKRPEGVILALHIPTLISGWEATGTDTMAFSVVGFVDDLSQDETGYLQYLLDATRRSAKD